MPLLLGLLLGDGVDLVLGHSPADGAGLLGAEVERQVLLALVEDAELGALVGVDDGEDAGDRLADVVAVGAIGVSMRMLQWVCSRFPISLSFSRQMPVSSSSPFSTFRLFLQDISGSGPGFVNWRKKNAHLAQLRLGTTGNLLGAQSHELLLELIELLLEILLVLAPKLLGSDLAGRLFTKKPPVSISSSFSRCTQAVGVYHCEGLSGLWWSLSSSRVAGGLGRRRSRSANSEIGRRVIENSWLCVRPNFFRSSTLVPMRSASDYLHPRI